MNNDDSNFVEKVLKGTRLAIKRLIKASAKEDKKLYISKNGKVVGVKAKELL